MKSFLRRHPVASSLAVVVLLAVAAIALAPWWIDLAPVRAKIERAASTAVAGTITYERMDLSWFPRAEVVVRSLKLSVPGTAQGTVGTVRVSPALLPLLRGRVELTKIAVDGLELRVDLSSERNGQPAPVPEPDSLRGLRALGSRSLDVELRRSRVVLSRPAGKSLIFEGIRLEAALRAADGRLDVALNRLSMESPKLILSGSLRADAGAPRIEATARGENLDVTDVRATLLAFAGDDPTVASILSIVRGGMLTSFTFASSGRSPGDLGLLERMAIRAAVKDANVRIPGPELDLADVSADVVLEGGVLSAEHAAARVGRTRALDGTLLLGLARADDRLRVDAKFRAHLAEVPAILSRVIRSRSFHEELARVQRLDGTAEGRITIGDLKSAPQTSVDVSDMRFSAHYGRVPWPVAVNRGRVSFESTRVGVSGLSGSLGRSTFSGVAARVRLGKRPVLESGSGSIVVLLEDFLEGVRTRPGTETLTKGVRRVSGSVAMDIRRFAGPLTRLGEASVNASGAFEGILFSSSYLPPLSIPSGRFTVDDQRIRVESADTRTLDASLRVSGTWRGWRGGEKSLVGTAEGELGPEAVAWGWKNGSLPPAFRPRAPLAIHGARLSFVGGALNLAGDFVVANGPRLTLDLAQGGGTTDVRNLTIADGDARADIAVRQQGNELDLRFKGRLDAATFPRIFDERPWRGGAIEGEFSTRIPLKTPARLTAEGRLTATDFEVPTPAGTATLERLDARATGSRLDVIASSFILEEQRFSANGSMTLGGDAVDVDMDVSTGDLPWTRVESALGRMKEKAEKEDAEKLDVVAAQPAPRERAGGTRSKASFAIRGAVRVSMDSFTHGNLVFRPVHADVGFEDGTVATARVRKADICGISTTGEARVLAGGSMALDARAESSGSDVNVPMTCLGLENVRMTGGYEANLQVTGEGTASDLARSLRGPLTLKLTKGRIGKATLLTRILGVLNATEVFAGKSGGRVGESMPYDAITVEGDVAGGKVSIRESSFVAPSITMAANGTVGFLDRSLDLVVLAHPLSTVDKVVQAVPVVRRILGHDFLAVAVKVTGRLDDPKVTVTPGRDVGKGLIGILERTVTLPVTVFDPPAPERK